MRSGAAKLARRAAGSKRTVVRQVNVALITGAVAFSVYSALSSSAHRRRIISRYDAGSGPATHSNLRGFLHDSVDFGEDLHDEEPPGPLREALDRFLLTHGIITEDIPKVLTMVGVLKYIGWGLTMLVSVRFRPVQRIFRLKGPQRLVAAAKARWPSAYQKAQTNIVKGADSLARTRFFTWLSGFLRQKPESIAMGLAEGFVLYKGTVLFQIPIAFYLSMKYFTSHANLVQIELDKPDAIVENWQEVNKLSVNQRRLVPRSVRHAFNDWVPVSGTTQLLAAKFGLTGRDREVEVGEDEDDSEDERPTPGGAAQSL